MKVKFVVTESKKLLMLKRWVWLEGTDTLAAYLDIDHLPRYTK